MKSGTDMSDMTKDNSAFVLKLKNLVGNMGVARTKPKSLKKTGQKPKVTSAMPIQRR